MYKTFINESLTPVTGAAVNRLFGTNKNGRHKEPRKYYRQHKSRGSRWF